MKSLVFPWSLLIVICCLTTLARSESGGPFAAATAKSTATSTDSSFSSWMPQWKFPDVTGSVKRATHTVTSTTSKAWNSASRTTKQAWRKTTEFLDPFPNDPKSSGSSKKNSSSSGWFGSSSLDDKPATIEEFLSQKSP